MFGGESYNPSAYFQDVWRLDYARQQPSAAPFSPTQSQRALDTLLHLTAFPHFEAELAPSRAPEPAPPFYRHEPPGGWGPLRPRQQSVLEWGGQDGSGAARFSAAAGLKGLGQLGGGLWLSALVGALLVLLLAGGALLCIRCVSRCRSDPDAKKRF